MARKIAWIEDSVSIAPIISPLEEKDFVFNRYSTFSEALSKLNDIINSDLILLDLILPPGHNSTEEGNDYLGLRLLEKIRKINPDVPVIVFSVVAEESDTETPDRLDKLNVSVKLTKPIRPSKLTRKIEEIFKE